MKFEIGKKEIVNGVEVVCYDELTEREREVFGTLADLITKTLKVYTCIIFKAYTNKNGKKLYRIEINGIDCNALNITNEPIYSINDVNIKYFFFYIVETIGRFSYYKFYDDSKKQI